MVPLTRHFVPLAGWPDLHPSGTVAASSIGGHGGARSAVNSEAGEGTSRPPSSPRRALLAASPGDPGPPQRSRRQAVAEPFTTVVDQVLAGDLVMAGNSNLLSAGRWRRGGRGWPPTSTGTRRRCASGACSSRGLRRELELGTAGHPVRGACGRARLYVNTSLSSVGQPGPGPARRSRGEASSTSSWRATTPGIAKVRESAAAAPGAVDAPGRVGPHQLRAGRRPRRLHGGRHHVRARRRLPAVRARGRSSPPTSSIPPSTRRR